MSIPCSRYPSDSSATVHFARGFQWVPHIFPQSEQWGLYKNIPVHPENSFLVLSCFVLSNFYRKQMNFTGCPEQWLVVAFAEQNVEGEWFPNVKRHCGLFRPRLIQFNTSSSPVSFSGSWKENTFPNQFRDFDCNLQLVW